MKKVIIGLAIFVCTMTIGKNIVKADEQIDYTICLTSRGYDILDVAKGTTCSFSSPSIVDSKFTKFYSFNFPNTSIIFNFKNETTLANNYINFYDKENDAYMIIQLKNSSITSYNMILNEKANEGSSVSSDTYDKFKENVLKTYTDNEAYNTFRPIIISKNKNSVYEKYYNSINNNSSKMYHRFERKINDETYYFYLSNGYSANAMSYGLNYNTTSKMYERVLPLNFDRFQLLEKSFEKIYINNVEKEFEPSDNLTELVMNNKYAVLFYPKEYNLLEKTCSKYKPGVETDEDGNVTVIPDAECVDEKYKFEFKQKGKFSFGFADLNTMDVVTAPLDLTPNFDEYLSFENYLETDEFKGGLIFYNRNLNQTTDDDGNVTVSYGTGSIKYNSDLYNYLIIDDKLDKINEDICLKDKNNKDKCYNIKNIPGAYDTADKKINNDTDSLNDFDYKSKLDSFIDSLKDSFDFLKENMKLFLNKVPPIIYLYIIVIPLFLLLFAMMK